MKLWIDNTGLQSAGLCLEGRANSLHDYDIRGLLQLATLIIYGNNIALNGFEDKKIASRSRELVDQLKRFNITEDILSIRSIHEDEYALACKTAADSIAHELRHSFYPNEHEILGGEPPNLPRGLRKRLVGFVNLVNEPDNSEKLRRVLEESLKEKAVGAVEFMLAVSPILREEIRKMIKECSYWDDVQSYQLNIFLRYYLNDALGEQSFAKYAPAVSRAELINRRSQYILDALGEELDEVVLSWRRKPLGIL